MVVQPSFDLSQSIVHVTLPNILTRFSDRKYLVEQTILIANNETIHDINNFILDMLPGDEAKYLSYGTIYKVSLYIHDEDILYLIEFLNSLKFSGILNHVLQLVSLKI